MGYLIFKFNCDISNDFSTGIVFLNTISQKPPTRADVNYLVPETEPFLYLLIFRHILFPDVPVNPFTQNSSAKKICQIFGKPIKHLVSGTF